MRVQEFWVRVRGVAQASVYVMLDRDLRQCPFPDTTKVASLAMQNSATLPFEGLPGGGLEAMWGFVVRYCAMGAEIFGQE